MTKKDKKITDEQLFERFIDGDENAYEELVRRYHRHIYMFVARFTGQRELAEDLTQETFIKVHQAASSFDTSRKFKPWLFSIAANKSRDALRAGMRGINTVSMQTKHKDQEQELGDGIASGQAGPESDVIDKEESDRVKTMVMKLPEHLREVLLLAYYEQLQYKEIAEILDIPLGTVKSRLHKAVQAFGKAWKANENERQSL